MGNNRNHQKNGDKRTTQALEAINAPAWGVFTTLAWIKFKDHGIVNRVFESAYRSGGDTRETEKTLAECSSEKFVLNTMGILRKSLHEGKVDCYGIRNGSREKIDKQKWIELDFCFSFPPIETPETLIVSQQTKTVLKGPIWNSLLFTVSQVMEVWPSDGADRGTDWGADWRDITIIITNQRTLLLKNKKYGKVEDIHPSVLGLCPKGSMNPNKKFKILGRMFDKEPVKVDKKTAPYISRLGKSLRVYFNIGSNPFYKNNKRYYPVFNIESQQTNQDKRLEKAADMSGKHIRFEQMTDPELARVIEESEEDDASTY